MESVFSWLYKKLEKKKLFGRDAAERIREFEIKLIKSLKENNSQVTGIISKEAGGGISRILLIYTGQDLKS